MQMGFVVLMGIVAIQDSRVHQRRTHFAALLGQLCGPSEVDHVVTLMSSVFRIPRVKPHVGIMIRWIVLLLTVICL